MSFEDTSGLTQLISERGQAVDKLYEKTLLRWVNAKLQQGGDQNVDNLSTAWKDGTNLIRLVEILSGKQAPRYHRNVGKKSFLGLENINTAMKMMADDGLKSDISTREFQEGNQKAVLSVLWSLVHFYQLQKPFQQGGALASGGESSRRNLFDWLQNKTRGYNNVSIKDMHQSWFDGMGLLALIDQYDNSLLPNKNFEEIDPSRKSENLDLAFDLAERHLGIPRLLDTEDILSTNHSQIPNEECFMTYLSFFPMAFLDKEQGRTPSTTTSATTTTTPTTRSTTTPSTATTSKQGKTPTLSTATREEVQAPSLIGDTSHGVSGAGSRIGGQQQLQQQKAKVPRPPSPPPASKVEQARQLTPSTLKHTSIPIVTAPLSEQPVTSLQQQGQQQTLQKQQQRGQQLQRQQPLQQQQGRKVSPPRPPTPPEPAPQVPESQQITPETLAESGYPSIVPTTPMEDAEEAKRIEEAKHPSAAAGGGGRISPRKQQPQRGPRAGARLAAGEGGGVVGQQQSKEGKKGGLMKKKKMAKKEPISQPTTTPSTTTTTTSPTKQRGGLKPGFLLGKKGKAKEGVAPVVQEEEQPIGEATVFEIGRLPDRTELHEQRRQEKLERKRRKQLERQVMTDHIYAPSEEQQPLQQQMESGVPVREGGLAPQLSPMGKKRMSGGIAPGVVGGAAHPRTQQQKRPIQETGERGRVAPVVEEEQPIGEATVFEIGRIPDITELHEQRRQEKLERKRRKRLEREVMTDHLFAPSEEQQPQQPLRETGEPIGEATVFEIGRIPDITEIHEQKRKEKLERKRRKQLERQVMTDHIYAPSEEQPLQQQPQQQRAQQIQGVLGQKREMEREMFVTRRPQSLEEIRADIERIRREARVAEEESRRIEADNEALRRQQPLLQQQRQPLYGDAAVEAEKKRIAYLKSYLAGLQSQTGLDPSRAALGDQQIRAELDEALLAKKRAKAERGRARREAAEAENERHKAEQRRIQAEREKLRAEAERLRAEEEKARVEGQVLARTLERLQAAQPSNISGITPLAETTRATTATPTTTTTTMPSNISGVTPLAETTMMTTPTTTTPLSLKGKEKLREGVIEETGAGGKSLPESEARKAQGIRDRPAVGQII